MALAATKQAYFSQNRFLAIHAHTSNNETDGNAHQLISTHNFLKNDANKRKKSSTIDV